MKKIKLPLAAAAVLLTLASCNTTNNNSTVEESKSSVVPSKASTESSVAASSSIIDSTLDSNVLDNIDMPEYKSTYEALIGEKLPEIRITSETGSNDFVTKPVSYAVKEQKKGWISNPNDPQLTAPDPYYEKCTISIKDDKGADFMTDASCQVKVRGNWTTDYEKKPLRLKFDEKQKMLGLNNNAKAKNWVLLASYKDWSLLRDSIGFYMAKLISRNYTSDFRLVDVYVNNTYFGVYLLAEQQQVNKNRVNINAPQENYTGNDIGYLMELDGYSGYEDYNFNMNYKYALTDVNGKSTTGLQSGYTIKSDIYSNSQVEFINKYMNDLWEICYQATYNGVYKEFDENYNVVASSKTNAYDVVSSMIDVESLVDAYILQEIICDPDIYWSSFYLDVDLSSEGDKLLRFEAPWDFDSTLGNKYNLNNATGKYAGVVGKDVNQNYECANPWMLLFTRTDWFNKLVSQKWTSISNDKIFDNIYTYMDYCVNTYNLDKNFTAWPSTRTHQGVLDELCQNAKACNSVQASSEYLKQWLVNRVAYLDSVYKK